MDDCRSNDDWSMTPSSRQHRSNIPPFVEINFRTDGDHVCCSPIENSTLITLIQPVVSSKTVFTKNVQFSRKVYGRIFIDGRRSKRIIGELRPLFRKPRFNLFVVGGPTSNGNRSVTQFAQTSCVMRVIWRTRRYRLTIKPKKRILNEYKTGLNLTNSNSLRTLK